MCSSEEITYDPEQRCLTFEGIEDVLLEDEEEWDNDDILDDETLDWDEEKDDLLDLDEDKIDDDWNAKSLALESTANISRPQLEVKPAGQSAAGLFCIIRQTKGCNPTQ